MGTLTLVIVDLKVSGPNDQSKHLLFTPEIVDDPLKSQKVMTTI